MSDESAPSIRYIHDGFPAADLRKTVRHITGYNEKGESVFLSTDSGAHHRLMGNRQAVANILGEERIMRTGDVSIQRTTAHKWHDITGNGTLPGRIMWVLVDCKDVVAGGRKMEGYLGSLAKDYVLVGGER
ncbi:uncharacterized protein BDV14DRAFT_196949 [Aspergillus stella-maris]|uniref:uncharacterized protein n=1 Tax=Aspergillus stella-maris TaxID=1810926 RepID=UPI003CCD5CFD